MAGKFVLKKGSSGKYHFNLVASNGQVIVPAARLRPYLVDAVRRGMQRTASG